MIPYGRQSIDEDDVNAVADVLRGDFLTGGPAVDSFEDALVRAVESEHAIACANGTAALHLSLMALDLGPGDAVVVPSQTFLATANAARYVGAEVRFADVDPDTGLMTPQTLIRALEAEGPGTVKAVIPVHLNGQCVDIIGIAEIARQRGLAIVEDACHALGGAITNGNERSLVGSADWSDLVCFSFHPVKTVAMGEGGAITTRNARLDERLRRLRNHGITRDEADFSEIEQAFVTEGAANPWYYEMPEIGFNYRASDIHCALGLSQIRKLQDFLAKRRQLAAYYDQQLAQLSSVLKPVPRAAPTDDGWHLYPVLIDFEALQTTRAALMGELRRRDIGTQVHYVPVHRQPYYRRRYGVQDLLGADLYYERVLTLPLFPAMTESDVDKVVGSLRDILER